MRRGAALNPQGVCLYLQLRQREARALFLRVLSIRLKVWGESHRDTKEAQTWLHACSPESEPVHAVAGRFYSRLVRHRRYSTPTLSDACVKA